MKEGPISEEIVIKMDPESEEWKKKIEEINEKLRNKYNGDLHEDNSFGYRKH